MTRSGLEGNGVSAIRGADLENSHLAGAAQSGAVDAKIDSELAIVVQAWSGLRDNARACILGIVRAAKEAGDDA